MLRTQIIGATGYGGLGMIELLLAHPEIKITSLLAKSDTGQPISTLFPHLRGFCELRVDEAIPDRVGIDADLVVFATPEGVAMEHAAKLRGAGIGVIDYSGDFRFASVAEHERYCERLSSDRAKAHICRGLLNETVYGIPELFRGQIEGARLVGNPGCFAVAMLLGLVPLIERDIVEPRSLIVDGKTGISGAGKKPSSVNHFPERNENLTPYRIAAHQHGVEAATILERASSTRIGLTFVPHLLRITRGLLCTIYGQLTRPAAAGEIRDVFVERFAGEPFLRVLPVGDVPSVKAVVGSNMCDIGVTVDTPNSRAVIVVAIDNLLKGQAGVALQNINLMFGFDEQLGLARFPMYP
jgi:N-acetyl-gamma-glutamyl-phosphate reductase